MTTRIRIQNLADATDTSHIEKALEAVPGVEAVALTPDRGEATVHHAGADPALLQRALAELGYLGEIT